MNSRESAFELPIHIHYRPSTWVLYGLTFSHIGALICLFPIVIPVGLKFLLGSAIVYSTIRTYRIYLESSTAIKPIQLILNAEDEWLIISSDGNSQASTLLAESFVHPYLVVLRFTTENKQYFVFILTPENVDQDILRRLRVRLKFRKVVTSN